MFRNRLVRSSVFGVIASLFLLAVYFLVMSLGADFNFALKELIRLKFWVLPLVIGFGVQIGLFSYLKSCQRVGQRESGMAAGSGVTSSVAMLACCAHHLTDFLPFIGLSIATGFLLKYQEWFLALGIISNGAGIFMMLRAIKGSKK